MNQLKEHPFPLVEYKISSGLLPMVESPLFQRETGIQHGFSTRKGGVSKEHLTSLNLSFSVEDARENVLENFRRIFPLVPLQPLWQAPTALRIGS